VCKSIVGLCLVLVACITWIPARAAGPGATASPSAAAPDTAELQAFKKAIRAKYDMKEKAFAAGDAKTIVTRFYAEDAQSVGEAYGIFHGRKDLWPLYTQAVKELNVKVTSVHTVVSGTAGWDWANFDVTPKDSKEKPFSLVILFLWQNVNGNWICKGDFYVYGNLIAGKLASPPTP
jgi:ketosteroid isomerase-like protein